MTRASQRDEFWIRDGSSANRRRRSEFYPIARLTLARTEKPHGHSLFGVGRRRTLVHYASSLPGSDAAWRRSHGWLFDAAASGAAAYDDDDDCAAAAHDDHHYDHDDCAASAAA